MACDKIVVVKVLELLLCCTCMIYKRITDDEAIRTFYLLQKLSQEWPLLNNVTWEQNGNIFTDIVFGSYIIITLGLLIGYLCGELNHGRKMEKFFLGFGALLFIIVGSLVFASLDSVPPHLVDNAAVLGTLALVTGLLFLLDVGLSRPKRPTVERLYKTTQTETATNSVDLLDKAHRIPNGDRVIGELRSSLKNRARTDEELRYPSHRDSPTDLTIQGNGQIHPDSTRRIPEERMTPEGYRRNGRFLPHQDVDHGRQPNGHITPVSSLRHDVQFPSDLDLRHERIPREQSQSHRSVKIVDIPFPSDLDLHHERIPREQPQSQLSVKKVDNNLDRRGIIVQDQKPTEGHHYQSDSHHSIKSIPLDKDFDQRGVILRDKKPSERHHNRVSEQENSTSSSGEQRYLEQSEINQRPESITPEQKHKTRSRDVYHGSDSEVDDLMHIPTVSFRLTERGEPIEARPGNAERSVRIKPQVGKGSIKDTKLLPMMPIASISEDTGGSRRARNVDTTDDEPKPKHSRHEKSDSPSSIQNQREKERYMFGDTGTGRSKPSSSKSIDIEGRKPAKFEGISHSPSPDEAHWRYDSRDANFIRMERGSPSSPSDPGFVRHTAHNWPDSAPRTPPQSPVDFVTPGGSRVQNWPDSQPSQSPQNWSGSAASIHQSSDSRSRTPQSPQNWSESAPQTPSQLSGHHVHWSPSRPVSEESDYAIASPAPPPPPPSKPPVSHQEQTSSAQKSRRAKQQQEQSEEDDDSEEEPEMPSGGSLTTQLLQKWLRQRKKKVGKAKSNP